MLARSFKTATDLGISEVERDALIKVLGMLERGELVHGARSMKDHPTRLRVFNMGDWHCGSAGCLGGWTEYVGGLEQLSLHERSYNSEGLHQLFYPDGAGFCTPLEMSNISTQQAAHALSNYLTTGEPRWDLALAE